MTVDPKDCRDIWDMPHIIRLFIYSRDIQPYPTETAMLYDTDETLIRFCVANSVLNKYEFKGLGEYISKNTEKNSAPISKKVYKGKRMLRKIGKGE